MKKKEKKVLVEKLLAAIKKVLEDNKADLTSKIEKVIKKSVKQIVKKTNKKRKPFLKKNKDIGLNSDKIKADGVAIVSP